MTPRLLYKSSTVMVREKDQNGNWRGGLCQVRTADDILFLPDSAQEKIKQKLLKYMPIIQEGCWEWEGSIFRSNGRPLICIGSRSLLASRVVFVIFRGPIGIMKVLHTCDKIICVRPDHLFLGTSADNSADMVQKGRQATGDRNGSRTHPERLVRGGRHPARINPIIRQGQNNGRATLTNAQVREIKKRYRPYVDCRRPSNRRELAKEFGVSPGIISAIIKGYTWKHVK